MPVQVTTTGNASSSSSSSNNNNNRQHQFISQAGDSGHETLLSDDDSPTPTVERASSEVIYSTISNGNHFAGRSRRSLAESNSTCINIKTNNNKNLNIDQGLIQLVNSNNNNSNAVNNNEEEVQHPPMIGVPNLKGKALIRPIAFRPTPGPNSGASTPTNGPLLGFRPPSNGPDSLHGLARASPATSQGGPFTPATNTNDGFAPGHPLVKDGRRHYGSSQELHVAAPVNPAFNKFNSLDRRALNKRQNSNGLLKLVTPTSGPESLPIVGRLTGAILNQFDRGNNKEPERRHSSYDSSTNSRNGPSGSRVSSRASGGQPSAININGLPDPFSGRIESGRVGINQSTSLYSSQESLHRGSGTPLRPTSSTGSTRPGAGTPQFQNLSGTVRTSANGLIPSTATASATVNNASNSSNNTTTTPRTTLTSLYHNNSSTASNTNQQQDMNQTPSPSDSAVGDLETMLKEKDTEINYLRETMEQNEQVIFKVYEEKEKMWERELRKIKGLYDNRLRASQQKSSKMEQALTNQTYQLQNEKRRLEKDLEEIKRQKEAQEEENERMKQEVASLRKLLETSSSSAGKIDLPQNKTSATNNESEYSTDSVHSNNNILKSQVEELKRQLEKKDAELNDLKEETSMTSTSTIEKNNDDNPATASIIIAKDHEIEKLQSELNQLASAVKELKTEASETKGTFETEKAHWLDEKEKVIRYQKQLQLNYVQMYKRNKTLEAEIESLNKNVDDLTSQLTTATTQNSSKKEQKSSSGSSGQSRLQKTSNSVRARLFKMSLHSESQC